LNFGMETVRDIILVLVPLVLSLTVHEFAHAWSAYKLGDNTAKSMGRMTLNPLVHIDPIGTILIPILPVLMSGMSFGLIGWAKPVPVVPHRFDRRFSMRMGMIITALAGPGSNFLLAFLAGAPYAAMQTGVIDATGSMAAISVLVERIFLINIGLGIFNMLPVYPLDGSRVLPEEWQAKMAKTQMLWMVGLLLLINVPAFMKAIFAIVLAIAGAFLSFWSLVF